MEGNGDCIDCLACVNVCPMGIDIRNGQQMACITCGLCIDACNDIMDKIGKPHGLIGYLAFTDETREREGKEPKSVWKHVFRPRTVLYTTLWAAVGIGLIVALFLRTEIDVNVTPVRNPTFVTLSDGFKSGAPRYIRRYARRLRKAQRALSRRVKGSHRWQRMRQRVARIQARIADCRRDFVHKLSFRVVRDHGLIAREDLNVKGLMRALRLSKSAADASLGELVRQIDYKAQWHGRDVIKMMCLGANRVGTGSTLHQGVWMRDSTVGQDSVIEPYSVLDGATVGNGCRVGPFARLRPGTVLGDGARVGNFVEIKNSRLGKKTKAGHLAYVGDAEVGDGANIGAGAVTCNYDGESKHRTEIGAGAFIGSDTMLVAPVTIGAHATTGAGSVITRDVPDGALAVERSPQRTVPGWAERRVRTAPPTDRKASD